jgi:pimeloyl-ACP methyl ester carboxylesterase
MPALSELRNSLKRFGKIFSVLLALVLFAFVSAASVAGFLLHEVLRPSRNTTPFDLSVMMGHPTTFPFLLASGGSREGWFFPGIRGGPVIVVCHGYLSQRADVLTLVTALQDREFNVFLFDFIGHGTSKGMPTLGYAETAELRSAIEGLATRDDVDKQHFGIWGVDMGGYAALEVASSDPRIAAVAVDDAYDDPRDMLQIEIAKSGLTALPGVRQLAGFGFRMVEYRFRKEPPLSSRLNQTAAIPKLFVESDDRQALAGETVRLFAKAPEPKTLLRERLSYRDMSDEDRKNYESQIVNFFLQNMSPH